ncbi:hypothetical protein HJC23_004072 [Cyclotella cryptica]|uniref:Thioredoxin domain-containing protein n=1 Tax=Cyclotella cryptica TaxID=29204 RepID=A0ABD3PKY5_9STRA
MKFNSKKSICKKNAAVLLIAVVLTISSGSHNGITSAFWSPSQNESIRSRCNTRHSVAHLWAINGSGGADSEKLVIEFLTDHNRDALLRPTVDPSRPILVDAFAPWCGPCKLLDKVLKKSQPRYIGKVDFVRWNVNDAENTALIKSHFIQMGYTLNKLPSLILYREGEPIADFRREWCKIEPARGLNQEVTGNGPVMEKREDSKDRVDVDVLAPEVAKEIKVARHLLSPLDFKARVMTERLRVVQRTDAHIASVETQVENEKTNLDHNEVLTDCTDETECWERMAETFGWKDRTVVPATDGILLPKRIVS